MLLVGLKPVSPSNSEAAARRDLSARAASFFCIWMLPILIAAGVGLATNLPWMIAAAWSAAFTWTGIACLLNAQRCGRLHCYFSGPILLGGAVLVAALALSVVDFGPHGLGLIVATTLILAALTYGLERIWGRYRRSNR